MLSFIRCHSLGLAISVRCWFRWRWSTTFILDILQGVGSSQSIPQHWSHLSSSWRSFEKYYSCFYYQRCLCYRLKCNSNPSRMKDKISHYGSLDTLFLGEALWKGIGTKNSFPFTYRDRKSYLRIGCADNVQKLTQKNIMQILY